MRLFVAQVGNINTRKATARVIDTCAPETEVVYGGNNESSTRSLLLAIWRCPQTINPLILSPPNVLSGMLWTDAM